MFTKSKRKLIWKQFLKGTGAQKPSSSGYLRIQKLAPKFEWRSYHGCQSIGFQIEAQFSLEKIEVGMVRNIVCCASSSQDNSIIFKDQFLKRSQNALQFIASKSIADFLRYWLWKMEKFHAASKFSAVPNRRMVYIFQSSVLSIKTQLFATKCSSFER